MKPASFVQGSPRYSSAAGVVDLAAAPLAGDRDEARLSLSSDSVGKRKTFLPRFGFGLVLMSGRSSYLAGKLYSVTHGRP
jgi:hypothetical protein